MVSDAELLRSEVQTAARIPHPLHQGVGGRSHIRNLAARISPEENAVGLLERTGTGLAAKLTEERNPDSARHKLQRTGGAGVQEELPASHAHVWRLRFRFSTVRVKAAALLWSHLVESHTPCASQSPNKDSIDAPRARLRLAAIPTPLDARAPVNAIFVR